MLLQGYFPSTAIKIWALVDLNIPHNACMLTITPLLTRARNIQLKKDTLKKKKRKILYCQLLF